MVIPDTPNIVTIALGGGVHVAVVEVHIPTVAASVLRGAPVVGATERLIVTVSSPISLDKGNMG